MMNSSRNLLSPRFLFFFFFFFLFSLASSSNGQDLLSCLSSGGVNNVTTHDSPTYDMFLDLPLQNLRFMKPSINKPVTIILPENKGQLGVAVRCARKGSWDIRVRSGGHSFEGLSSYSTTPFVLLDLMNLNRVRVDLISETAWAEAGATLGQIYEPIVSANQQYAFPSGMCPTIGSGGHFSGGGYGMFTRKFGLSADNIVDAILVDAGGRLLDRKAMGEEVFWAIRGGGGGSFGVIAAWKLKLHKVPETVMAFRLSKTGTAAEMAELWYKWQLVSPKLDDNFFLQGYLMAGSPEISLNFMGLYIGPKSTGLADITRLFPELALLEDDCMELNWLDAYVYIRGLGGIDLKNRFSYAKTFSKTKADFVRSPIPLSGIIGALQMVAKQPKASLLLDPYGGVMNEIKNDAIAFPHRAGNLYAIEYFVDWQEEDDGESGEYLDWIRKLYTYMTPFVTKERAIYVNNVDLDLGTIDWANGTISSVDAVTIAKAWGEKYFLGNYERLVRAKTLIDPDNVFRHPQSIPSMAPSASSASL